MFLIFLSLLINDIIHVFVSLPEEDAFNTYSSQLVRLFMAEGIVNKHDLFLASYDLQPMELLKVAI